MILLLIPWPSKAEHGEKMQPDDELLAFEFVEDDAQDDALCWMCHDGVGEGLCPFHAQDPYPPIEGVSGGFS